MGKLKSPANHVPHGATAPPSSCLHRSPAGGSGTARSLTARRSLGEMYVWKRRNKEWGQKWKGKLQGLSDQRSLTTIKKTSDSKIREEPRRNSTKCIRDLGRRKWASPRVSTKD